MKFAWWMPDVTLEQIAVDFVVGLCWRDRCTDARRGGSSHDSGADVLGILPDGRSMMIQCTRYRPKSRTSREVRDLLGARAHFKAEVAIFVTTTYFSENVGAGVGSVVRETGARRRYLGAHGRGESRPPEPRSQATAKNAGKAKRGEPKTEANAPAKGGKSQQ
ncbi:restriction endonuclease [Streptomyces parvus]|uniref:restriction endonuclease n=1 Tax=Streptomyces parvus TaxID=66428 RepID=UPI00332F2632